MEFTPDIIDSLQPNEVFVYGSNQFASHGGGAAKVAHTSFGAVMNDIPIGLVDQSYGIITTSFLDVKITHDFVADQVKVLYGFAALRPDLIFFVTKIGTGIAGWPLEDIAAIFRSLEFMRPANIILPQPFIHPKN
jgi:hypothetical protein